MNQEIKIDVDKINEEIIIMDQIHTEIVDDYFDIALICSRGDTVEEIRHLEEELKQLKTNLGVLYKNTSQLYKKIRDGFTITDEEVAKMFNSR